MKSFPSTELKQNLGDVLATAAREPVSITRHNKARFVLMSQEAYEAHVSADPRRSYTVEEMPSEHLEMLERALREIGETDDRA